MKSLLGNLTFFLFIFGFSGNVFSQTSSDQLMIAIAEHNMAESGAA